MQFTITSSAITYNGGWTPLYGSVISDISYQVNARIDAMEKEGFDRQYRRDFYINSLYEQLLAQHGVDGALPTSLFTKSMRVRDLSNIDREYVIINDMRDIAGYVDINYTMSMDELVEEIRREYYYCKASADEKILEVCGEDVYIDKVFTPERKALMLEYMALPLTDETLFTEEKYLTDVYIFDKDEIVEICTDVEKTRILYDGSSNYYCITLDRYKEDMKANSAPKTPKGLFRTSTSRLSLNCLVMRAEE